MNREDEPPHAQTYMRTYDTQGASPDPMISAIVVTYNSAGQIEKCLNCLTGCQVNEIHVWDNHSSDRTRDILNQYSEIVVHHSTTNLGFAAAVNLAARCIPPTDDLLLVNPDCYLTNQTLQELSGVLNATEDLGAVVPSMVYGTGEHGISGGSWPTITKEIVSALGIDAIIPPALREWILGILLATGLAPALLQYERSRSGHGVVELDWVSGFCLMIKRKAWDKTHGFDTRFFMYFEDVALCRNLSAYGYRVACVTFATAVHEEGASSTSRIKNHLYRRSLLAYWRGYGTTFQRRASASIQRWRNRDSLL